MVFSLVQTHPPNINANPRATTTIAHRLAGQCALCETSTLGKKHTKPNMATATPAKIAKNAPKPQVVWVQAIIGIAVALTEKVMT